MPSYDPQNIFAKILRGELPCHKVYEDDKVLAFLDIMPRAPGHTLVLPKAPARNLLDVQPDDLAAVAMAAQKIANAAMKVFSAERHHHPAVQRGRRRPGGVPPASARHPAQGRGRDEAAGKREGKARRAVRSGAQARRGARGVDRSVILVRFWWLGCQGSRASHPVGWQSPGGSFLTSPSD